MYAVDRPWKLEVWMRGASPLTVGSFQRVAQGTLFRLSYDLSSVSRSAPLRDEPRHAYASCAHQDSTTTHAPAPISATRTTLYIGITPAPRVCHGARCRSF